MSLRLGGLLLCLVLRRSQAQERRSARQIHSNYQVPYQPPRICDHEDAKDAVHTPRRELVETVSLPFTEVCYSYLVLLLIHVLRVLIRTQSCVPLFQFYICI